MSGDVTTWRERADEVFGRVLPLIDSVLTQEYCLGREEKAELERRLHEWFLGFVRRPGTPGSDELLKPHLIMMACHAAHVFWSGRLTERTSVNDSVRRALALGPQQVAIELEKTSEKVARNQDLPGDSPDESRS